MKKIAWFLPVVFATNQTEPLQPIHPVVIAPPVPVPVPV
jgi:hypothetical protein